MMMASQVLPICVFVKKKYTSYSFRFKYSYGPDFSTKKLYLWVVVVVVGCLLFDFNVIGTFPVIDEWNTRIFGSSDDDTSFNFLALISGCVLAPLAEEAIFRGAIERSLFEKNWKPWLAIVISTLLFAVPHANLFAFISLFGFIVGWLYYRTGCIWPGILMHAIYNTLLFVSLFIAGMFIDESVTEEELLLPPEVAIPMMLLGAVLLFFSVKEIASITKDRVPIESTVNLTEGEETANIE